MEVVGDLPEEDAKRYILGGSGWPGLIKSGDLPPVDDAVWEKVFAVCGGNIGLLQRCINEAGLWRNWDTGELKKALTALLP